MQRPTVTGSTTPDRDPTSTPGLLVGVGRRHVRPDLCLVVVRGRVPPATDLEKSSVIHIRLSTLAGAVLAEQRTKHPKFEKKKTYCGFIGENKNVNSKSPVLFALPSRGSSFLGQ